MLIFVFMMHVLIRTEFATRNHFADHTMLMAPK